MASEQRQGVDSPSAIDYFHLVSDSASGWVPLLVDDIGGRHLTADGQPLGDAAVALHATLLAAALRSNKIDPAFGLIGLRLGPHLSMPQRHHNVRQLTIVFGGELIVDGDGNEARTVRSGQFFVTEADTPYSLIAGPQGATFTETLPPKFTAELETYWHLGKTA